MENTWSRKKFSQKGGISDRKALFYTEQGMFPALCRDVGRGTSRTYTTTELRDLRLILELTKFGLPLNKIKIMIKYIHSIQDKWLPNGKLIDEPFYVSWDPMDDKPFDYYTESVDSGRSVEKIESPLSLIINLNVIFQGTVE
ncbi:MAG: MerR family transcriptional regulator [Proteobacteria bacterium]|nr:MerR family transcriptional regulator [Pseudomonadota bacterium]